LTEHAKALMGDIVREREGTNTVTARSCRPV
jgi:hypothetical protein